MTEPRIIAWKRITVEAVAIVASILLAFAIDAWWQERNEVEQERELLQALLDDFTVSKDETEDWRRFHLAVEASTKTLLEGAISIDSALTGDKLRRLVSDLTWFDSDSHFATGALNSLVNGGNLSKIRNDTLRRLVADWPSRIVSAEVIQRQDYEFFTEVLAPYLRANTRLPLLAAEDSARPGQTQTVFPKIAIDMIVGTELTQLLDSNQFQNILMQKSWIQFDILRRIDEVEILLDQTIAQLNDELRGR